jgi:hypothetical protein
MSVELSLEKALELLDSITWNDNVDLESAVAEWPVEEDAPLQTSLEASQPAEEQVAVHQHFLDGAPPVLDVSSLMPRRSLFLSSLVSSEEDRGLAADSNSAYGEDVLDLHKAHSMINDVSYFDAVDVSALSPVELDLWSDCDPGTDAAARTESAGAAEARRSLSSSFSGGAETLSVLITGSSGGATMTFSVSSWEQWITTVKDNPVS